MAVNVAPVLIIRYFYFLDAEMVRFGFTQRHKVSKELQTQLLGYFVPLCEAKSYQFLVILR